MECAAASLQQKQAPYVLPDFSLEPFKGLPSELIFHIFKFLQAVNLHIFSEVNKHAKEQVRGYVNQHGLHFQLFPFAILSYIDRVGKKKIMQSKNPHELINFNELLSLMGYVRSNMRTWDAASRICVIVEKLHQRRTLKSIQKKMISEMIACGEEEKGTKVIKESQALSDFFLMTKLKRGDLDESIEQKVLVFESDHLREKSFFLYAKALAKKGNLDEATKFISEKKIESPKYVFKILTKIALIALQQKLKSEEELQILFQEAIILSICMQAKEDDPFDKILISILDAKYHVIRGDRATARSLLIIAEESLRQIVINEESKSVVDENILASSHDNAKIKCLIEIANVRCMMGNTQLAINTLNKAKEISGKIEDNFKGKLWVIKAFAKNSFWQEAENLCLEIKNAEFLCEGLSYIISERTKRGMTQEAQNLVSIGQKKLEEAKELNLTVQLYSLWYMAEACLTSQKKKS